MRLFSNRSQKRSKCGKNISDTYHILTSSVIYYWTDARQHGIYLLLLDFHSTKLAGCDWLIIGHVPLIKFKCISIGIQLNSCCPHSEYNST